MKELVVISPLSDWTGRECHGSGDLLVMEGPGPLCLACAELDHLVFLGRGDAALTRRAKAASRLWAVVIRFSRSRKRYERQGLLVEEHALKKSRGGMPGGRRGAGAAQGARCRTSGRPGRGAGAVDGRRHPAALSAMPAGRGGGHRAVCYAREKQSGRKDYGGEGDGRATLGPRGRCHRPSWVHAI